MSSKVCKKFSGISNIQIIGENCSAEHETLAFLAFPCVKYDHHAPIAVARHDIFPIDLTIFQQLQLQGGIFLKKSDFIALLSSKFAKQRIQFHHVDALVLSKHISTAHPLQRSKAQRDTQIMCLIFSRHPCYPISWLSANFAFLDIKGAPKLRSVCKECPLLDAKWRWHQKLKLSLSQDAKRTTSTTACHSISILDHPIHGSTVQIKQPTKFTVTLPDQPSIHRRSRDHLTDCQELRSSCHTPWLAVDHPSRRRGPHGRK